MHEWDKANHESLVIWAKVLSQIPHICEDARYNIITTYNKMARALLSATPNKFDLFSFVPFIHD